jgi:hypothetical protein
MKTIPMDRVKRFDSFMRRVNNKYYYDNKRMDLAYQIILNHKQDDVTAEI